MFNSEIIADSLFENGVRLTTAKWTFPRYILAEVNTHRMKSSNAASSRAIPIQKMRDKILEGPFIPVLRKEKRGMQADVEEIAEKDQAVQTIENLLASAIEASHILEKLGVHKQYINRYLEPWMYCSIVVSATDWQNMFAQRCSEFAEPSFNKICSMFKKQYDNSIPRNVGAGEWHTPMFSFEAETNLQLTKLDYEDVIERLIVKLNLTREEAVKAYPRSRFNDFVPQDIAVGRIAKISYDNLETGKIDIINDIRLAVELSRNVPGHWSPFEHVARMAEVSEMTYKISQLQVNAYTNVIQPRPGEIGYCGNFRGATQYRKLFEHENIPSY